MPNVNWNFYADMYADLTEWQVSCFLRSSYSATVHFTDEGDQWTDDAVLGKPIEVWLEASADLLGNVPAGCWEGDVRWVYGLVSNREDNNVVSDHTVSLRVVSFASRLSNKPANTERLSGTCKEALELLASRYGGLPAAMYDFTDCGANPMHEIVAGSDLLGEMGRIAAAGRCDLCVQRDGVLTAVAWKDASSAVDTVIPPQAVEQARRVSAVEGAAGGVPTRIRVRGKYRTDYDCGEVDFTKSQLPSTSTPAGGGNQPTRGAAQKCIMTGKGTPAIIAKQAADGNGEDIDNSDVQTSWGSAKLVGEGGESSPPGFFQTQITGPDDYVPAGEQSVTVERQGRKHPMAEIEAAVAKYERLAQEREAEAQGQESMTRRLGAKPGGRGVGGVSGGFAGFAPWGGGSPDHNTDEPEATQIELVLEDPDLMALYGVIDEDIWNPYVSNLDTLFEIAVRRFQEAKMLEDQWDVRCAYLPCLQLGDVVTFTVPQTLEEITGAVTGIRLGYEPSPSATMDLTVEALTSLGTTEYVSPNLLECSIFQGAAVSTENAVWTKSDKWCCRCGDGRLKLDASCTNPADAYAYQDIYLGAGDYEARIFNDNAGGGAAAKLILYDSSLVEIDNVDLLGGESEEKVEFTLVAADTVRFEIRATIGIWWVWRPTLVKVKTA